MSRPTFPEHFNLADYFLFDRIAEGLGDRIAVRSGALSWTYAQVADRAARLGAALQAAGVRPDERVLIILPDTPPFVWSIFATLKIGAVLAMGNPDAPPPDLAYLVEYTRASALVTLPRVAAAIAPTLRASSSLRALLLVPDAPTGGDPEVTEDLPAEIHHFPARWLATALREAPPLVPFATRRDDVAVWLFTSGSTGKSKAAIHTHRDFAFNTEVYAKATVGYRRDDVTVSVPRLYFGYATGTNLFFPFAVGATACLFAERPTPESLYAAIERHRPTVVTNVPTMLGKLLDWDADRGARGYEIKILPREADGPGAPPLPPDEVGVLWVKGDSVALAYHQDRDKSWQTFHGAWCCTGDLFRIDGEGYLWFVGRADDLLKVSGLWVSPLEVEECLMKHPAVALAAVVGALDEGLLKPKAYVVPRGDAQGRGEALVTELQRHVKEHLSKHKYPRWIELVDDLPKNDRGKVDRKALKAREGQP
jgi:acyl-coenzyme A synthetase/AMP-(fatty) acid ligase